MIYEVPVTKTQVGTITAEDAKAIAENHKGSVDPTFQIGEPVMYLVKYTTKTELSCTLKVRRRIGTRK